MSTKFEQLLDLLVNEEMDKANELFHEIVVEKSRDIYENLIAEEEEDEQEESVDEAEEEEDESVEETMDLEDSYSMEADDEDENGFAQGDAADEFGADTMGDEEEMGDEESGEDSAIFDIKNAIADLEAAFAELERAQGGEEADMGMDSEFDDEEEPEDEMMGMGMGMHEGRRVTREYVEKVGSDWEKGSTQKTQGQLAGAGTGERQSNPVDGKSPVSSGKGKPTTGATAGNIAKGATGEGNNTGTSPAGKAGGFLKNAQDMKTGNGNVPGGSMGIKNLSKVTQNSKTPGPVGSGTGDKAGQTSVGQAKSPLNGAPNRNA
jgi:hypothetical protein